MDEKEREELNQQLKSLKDRGLLKEPREGNFQLTDSGVKIYTEMLKQFEDLLKVKFQKQFNLTDKEIREYAESGFVIAFPNPISTVLLHEFYLEQWNVRLQDCYKDLEEDFEQELMEHMSDGIDLNFDEDTQDKDKRTYH